MSAAVLRRRAQRAAARGEEAQAGQGGHAALRLWLRLLACTSQIEDEIRRRLRARFGTSLARFDYLAQLHRHAAGLPMKELSRCLMVTRGNVTGLTDELERDGMVSREPSATDGRSWTVRLSARGRREFETMARAHERWVVELFAGLDPRAMAQLHAQLGALRAHLSRD